MKNTGKYLRAGLLVSSILVAQGCMARTITAVSDHPKQSITDLETLRVNNYLIFRKFTHEFWHCEDKGAELVCTRQCDTKATDLVCPQATGQATNVR